MDQTQIRRRNAIRQAKFRANHKALGDYKSSYWILKEKIEGLETRLKAAQNALQLAQSAKPTSEVQELSNRLARAEAALKVASIARAPAEEIIVEVPTSSQALKERFKGCIPIVGIATSEELIQLSKFKLMRNFPTQHEAIQYLLRIGLQNAYRADDGGR